jgi:hypothetical protein
MLAPDAALVTGRLTGRYRMDKRESDFVELYTGVWVRQGETWRVRHEHGSLARARVKAGDGRQADPASDAWPGPASRGPYKKRAA